MTTSSDFATGLSVDDEQAIRHLVKLADQAQSDASVLPGLHLPQAVIVNIAGRRVLGRDAFTAAMTEALASPMKDVLTSVDIDDIRLATPDVAIVSCVKTVHDNREGSAPTLPIRGALTYIAIRGNHTWQIALAQTTPINYPYGNS